MSAPKILIQIVITGTQIFGKALYAAGAQAIKNAKYTPQAISSDITGVNNATTGSLTDKLTREHRLTLDEAHLILNSKREDSIEHVLERYNHLFKVNSPPQSTPGPVADSRRPPNTFHSHYLQSKILRARERIEAEHKLLEQQEEGSSSPPSNPTSPPAP